LSKATVYLGCPPQSEQVQPISPRDPGPGDRPRVRRRVSAPVARQLAARGPTKPTVK